MLGKTAALTDINQNPYQPYAGQRIAGFTPMQAQGFENVANQQVAGQIGEASNMASQVGRTSMGAFNQGQQLGQAAQGYGGQGANYGAQGANMAGMGFGAGQRFEGMATSPGATQAFMSPYMQNVVDYEKQNAIRDYGMASQGRNYQAAKSGAFGGSRQAVAEGEANRGLMNQLGGIQAKGTQQAFDNAQKQMQFGADLGLRGMGAGYQGLGLGIQGAQTGLQGVQGAVGAGQYGLAGLGQSAQAAQLLGQLGASQFAQQRDITNDMMRAGAVQQGQQQQGLDVAYQDFTKAQNYPYQQLAFGSDMLRGLPLSQAAQSQYTAPASQLSQLGGLGTTALGIYGMSGGFKKDGGVIKGYKDGGSIGYLDGGQVEMMTTEQLEKLLASPNLNPLEIAMIQKALMERQRMASNPQTGEMMARSGIGSIGTGDMVPETMAAEGGIIAFKNGGSSKEKQEAYVDWLENQVKESIMAQKNDNAFEKTDSQIAESTKGLKSRKDIAPWAAVAEFGANWMAGKDPNTLSNIGAASSKGLGAYARELSGIQADEKDILAQQRAAEQARLARSSGLTGQMQTSLGQQYNRMSANEQVAATKGLGSETKRANDLIRAQNTWNDAVKDSKADLRARDKTGSKYRKNPEQFLIDAENEAKKNVSPDILKSLGLNPLKAETVVKPSAKTENKGPFVVAVPGKGKYTFPTQEAADEFKKQANLR
jgi:hypothetical protein